ncbi:cytidine/deoxycytidylate deaminase family protein [Isoalcanivorax pacificus W11-5]|uniref:tRNA-specific adenosine deaminase n=1 Tax=Isoalcanivorax pacificus W11-5 TaxID=391936 RepID=A0A0B4XKL9_9GAMM|nr:tRNA adenosine(34) deaminase TadA [Isoalcanivorax pacificus]AJD47240.1 cytidine/deoxycytidylate deaminase family protein [Isoalcanivorax pacificus W11-5]
MTDDEKWMHEALALAKQGAAEGEVPVGALVVRDGQVLGRGWNRPIAGHDPTAHAEVMALRDAARHEANYRLTGATLYVTIEPCTMCFGALMHARIARLVYGATEPRAGTCVSQLRLPEQSFYNHRLEVTGGVLAEESAIMLRGFFRQRRGSGES